jgi:DNA topoisomerase VI subunit B
VSTETGRRTFVVRRGLEYFSESELRMQLGADRPAWPVAILKELVDNGLDAAETAGVAPVVDVTIEPDGFTVEDNGPGIPAASIARSLDYDVRVSDKLGYVAPTRGRLGNALKTAWAGPLVATGESVITVHSHGQRHEVPVISHDVSVDGTTPGTKITISWRDVASYLDGSAIADSYKMPTARELVEAYAAFNPHATFTLNGTLFPATSPGWRKWAAAHALVPAWYTPETFRELVAHYVASERYGASPITVRAFIAMFRGLTSTAKQKKVTAGFGRDYLHELVAGHDLDDKALTTLLERMQAESRPPKPQALGVIGKEHLSGWMVRHGGVVHSSIRHKKITGVIDGIPHVIEVAFGVNVDDEARRRIITGLNWSPTLDIPAREIQALIQEMRGDPDDPVVLIVHMARPVWNYTGRGKEAVAL